MQICIYNVTDAFLNCCRLNGQLDMADRGTARQVLQVRQRLKPVSQSRVSRVTQLRRACINIYSIFKTIPGHVEFMLMHWSKLWQ